MEAITNAATTVGNAAINATAAAKTTIFGPGEGQEPVAGETADKPATDRSATNPTSTATDPTSTATPDTKGPTTTDAGAAAPDSGAKVEQKQQGADRPAEEPGSENVAAIKDKKADAEDKMETGGSSESGKSDAPEPLGGKTTGGPGGMNKDDLGSTSKEPGTGTQYVKSTGLEKDGGDFDATKPGAAREADRLLEEKGIKHDGPNTGPPQTPEGSKERKPSIATRIKEKLHIGSKKDKTPEKSKDASKGKEADKPKEEAKSTGGTVQPKEGTALAVLKNVDSHKEEEASKEADRPVEAADKPTTTDTPTTAEADKPKEAPAAPAT